MPRKKFAAKQFALAAPEVIAVIAIIAILALSMWPSYYERHARSRYSRVLDDLAVQRRAVEAYAADHSKYPRSTWGCAPFLDKYAGSPIWYTLAREITTPIAYLTHLMEDPNAGGGFFANTKAERLYQYYSTDWFSYMIYNGRAWPACPFPDLPGFVWTYGNNKTVSGMRAYFGAYMLWANGPLGVSGDTSQYLLYDPTNGTVSQGNIFIGQKSPTPYYVPPNWFF